MITGTVLSMMRRPVLHTQGVRIRSLEKDVVYASNGGSKYAGYPVYQKALT